MKSSVRGTSFRSARVLIAIALASMMLAGGSAASASGGKAGASVASAGGNKEPVFVSGNSTFSDCGLPGSDYALSLTGDLEGCWSTFIQGHKCKALADYDLYFEEGREEFLGEYRGKKGEFRTTYTFEGVYAKGFCQSFDPHPRTGWRLQSQNRWCEPCLRGCQRVDQVYRCDCWRDGRSQDRGIPCRHWGKQLPLLRPYRFRCIRLISAHALGFLTAFRVAPRPSAWKAVQLQAVMSSSCLGQAARQVHEHGRGAPTSSAGSGDGRRRR
jgi:hypothetical protein